jgi:hypothetical protein
MKEEKLFQDMKKNSHHKVKLKSTKGITVSFNNEPCNSYLNTIIPSMTFPIPFSNGMFAMDTFMPPFGAGY